jgi:hypothetical protein
MTRKIKISNYVSGILFALKYCSREFITGKVNREKIIEEKQICRETLSGKFKNFFTCPVYAPLHSRGVVLGV